MKWIILVAIIAFLLGWGLHGSLSIGPSPHGVSWNGNVQVVKTGGQ